MCPENNGLLEVEDEDERQRRIQASLENLNSTRRETHPLRPPTELLARVQAFLPQLAASNDALAQRLQSDPESLNIEAVKETDTQVIEMDLGLGVFEDRSKKTGGCASDSESEDCSDEVMSSSSSDTSDSSSSSSSASDTGAVSMSMSSRPMKPLPKRKGRPEIIVLSST